MTRKWIELECSVMALIDLEEMHDMGWTLHDVLKSRANAQAMIETLVIHDWTMTGSVAYEERRKNSIVGRNRNDPEPSDVPEKQD